MGAMKRLYHKLETGEKLTYAEQSFLDTMKGKLLDVTVGEPTPARKLTFEEHLTIERGSHENRDEV